MLLLLEQTLQTLIQTSRTSFTGAGTERKILSFVQAMVQTLWPASYVNPQYIVSFISFFFKYYVIVCDYIIVYI